MLIAETIVGTIGKVLDKFVADKDQREQLKAEVSLELLRNETEITKMASKNVNAEIKGESWLQRNWRPILMLLVIVIVANNFLVAPYVRIFSGVDLSLELPAHLYELMVIGVGGYTIGRSGEKIIREWKNVN